MSESLGAPRIRYGLMTPAGFVEQPHWEHGYRCHGYWLGNKRLAVISLGPPGLWARQRLYMWSVAGTWQPEIRGAERTLRKAKRQVERALAPNSP